MAAQPQPPPVRMTVEEYLAFDRASQEARYEYFDGAIRQRVFSTLNHATIAMNFVAALQQRLRGTPCRSYDSGIRVRISPTRFIYADAVVSCDERDRGTVDILQSPNVVIEVLSPSTERFDRNRKAEYYRACPTVQEYVLVDAERQHVEVQRRAGDLWQLLAYGPGDTVELASLAVAFPLADLYEEVDVPPETDDDAPPDQAPADG